MRSEYPGLKVISYNIQTQNGMAYNEALCQKFGVPSHHRSAAPSVFMAHNYLVKDEINIYTLGELAEVSLMETTGDEWTKVDVDELKKASESIRERGKSYRFHHVSLAGLSDGANPCVLAAIILLFFHLRPFERRPKEILKIMGAFVLAVYITIIMRGIGISGLVSGFQELAYASRIISWLMAIGLFIVSIRFIFSWIPYVSKKIRLKMTQHVEIPESIRPAAEPAFPIKRHMVIACLWGMAVSILNVVNIGTDYTLTITYMIKDMATAATLILALMMVTIYNMSFIAPSAILAASCAALIEQDGLAAFLKRYMVIVKFIFGLFLFALFVKFIPHAVL